MDKQTKTDKYAHHGTALPSIHRRLSFIIAGTGTGGTGSLSTGTGTEKIRSPSTGTGTGTEVPVFSVPSHL